MIKNEVLQLEQSKKSLINFMAENIPDVNEGDFLKTRSESEYDSIIIDIRTSPTTIVKVNEVDFYEIMLGDNEIEIENECGDFLDLEIKIQDREPYNYNDVIGFILKDGMIFTCYSLEDDTIISHIVVVHTDVEQEQYIYLRALCKEFNFSNVKIL